MLLFDAALYFRPTRPKFTEWFSAQHLTINEESSGYSVKIQISLQLGIERLLFEILAFPIEGSCLLRIEHLSDRRGEYKDYLHVIVSAIGSLRSKRGRFLWLHHISLCVTLRPTRLSLHVSFAFSRFRLSSSSLSFICHRDLIVQRVATNSALAIAASR